MLIVTINEIPGKKLEALGVVRGSTVQSRNLRTPKALAQMPLWGCGTPPQASCRARQRSLLTERR